VAEFTATVCAFPEEGLHYITVSIAGLLVTIPYGLLTWTASAVPLIAVVVIPVV
jgi:hypothetical protein